MIESPHRPAQHSALADPRNTLLSSRKMTHNALNEGFVSSKKIGDGRRVWVLEPNSDTLDWTAIFLDAELYMERVGAAAVLGRLQTAGGFPSLRSIFVSSEDTAARHTDYTCNADYTDFIAGDVINDVSYLGHGLLSGCPGVGLGENASFLKPARVQNQKNRDCKYQTTKPQRKSIANNLHSV